VPAQNPDKVLTVESRPAGGSYLFGAYRFDLMGRALFKGSNRLALTPKAVETLRVLLEHAGNLVTTEQLMREVWPASFVEPGSITRNVADLKRHSETAVTSKRSQSGVTDSSHPYRDLRSRI
jgi:DNA-binding response OmpR family regulator